MLKMRLGAVPDTDVNMPHPDAKFEQPLKPVIGAIIGPETEDGVIKRALIVRSWQTSAKKPSSAR